MKYYEKILLTALSVMVLYGCTTQPQVVKPYPEAPKELMMTTNKLKQLNDDPSIKDVTTTIAENYKEYHIVAARLHALQEWTKRVREESLNVSGRNKNNKEEVR